MPEIRPPVVTWVFLFGRRAMPETSRIEVVVRFYRLLCRSWRDVDGLHQEAEANPAGSAAAAGGTRRRTRRGPRDQPAADEPAQQARAPTGADEGVTTHSVVRSTDMSETDWWANLLQGALSAVIGGVVAALTAWAVVTMTARRTQRQTTYQNAVLACQALAGEIHTLAQVIFTAEPWRWRRASAQRGQLIAAVSRFFTLSHTHQAVIGAWDPALAERLLQRHIAIQKVLTPGQGLGSVARRWTEADVDQFNATLNQLFGELRRWLGQPAP